MESPVPFFIVLTLISAVVYQLSFRYEHWTGGEHRNITYERDNLTGETHVIRPGERVDFFKRLLGDHTISRRTGQKQEPEQNPSESSQEEGFLMNMVADSPEKSKPSSKNTTASAPTIQETRPIKLIEDLNGDGSLEQIIMNKTADDGLLDISVLNGSRELFYGRGKELLVLPSKQSGWNDLSLKLSPGEQIAFHYSPSLEGYEAHDPE